MAPHSLKFILGLILLFTNQPFGWGGILLCSYLGKSKGRKMYYALGIGLYVLSWAMLGLGAFLAGPEGLRLVKNALRSYRWETIAILDAVVIGVAAYVIAKKKKDRKVIPA